MTARSPATRIVNHASESGHAAAPDNRRRDRRAILHLVATPELLTLIMVITGLLAVLSGVPAAFLVAWAVVGGFGWLYLSSGDSFIAAMIIAGIGILTALVMSQELEIEGGQLWWTTPGLAMVAAETALTFNQYRRRKGEISNEIVLIVWQNVTIVIASALSLGWVLQRIADRTGRVTWPWFSLVSITLTATALLGLLALRRRATPADRRRYTPGRRILPPPR